MADVDDAISSLTIRCPSCGAADVPGTFPTLTRHAGGRMTCTRCLKNFHPTSWAYRMTQHQLDADKKDQP